MSNFSLAYVTISILRGLRYSNCVIKSEAWRLITMALRKYVAHYDLVIVPTRNNAGICTVLLFGRVLLPETRIT